MNLSLPANRVSAESQLFGSCVAFQIPQIGPEWAECIKRVIDSLSVAGMYAERKTLYCQAVFSQKKCSVNFLISNSLHKAGQCEPHELFHWNTLKQKAQDCTSTTSFTCHREKKAVNSPSKLLSLGLIPTAGFLLLKQAALNTRDGIKLHLRQNTSRLHQGD